MSRKKKTSPQIPLNFEGGAIPSRKIVKAISTSKVLDYFNRINKSKWAFNFSKLLLNLEGWESPLCRLNWKIRSGKNNRLYFYLQVINSNKNGAENNLLLNPSTVEIAETPEKFQERHKERTRKGLNKAPHPGNKYNCLTSQILYSGLLPTPTTADYKGARSKEALEAAGRNETNSLSDKFAESGKSVTLNPLFVTEMMGFPTDWLILPNIEPNKP
jgi:hypothetical protein